MATLEQKEIEKKKMNKLYNEKLHNNLNYEEKIKRKQEKLERIRKKNENMKILICKLMKENNIFK